MSAAADYAYVHTRVSIIAGALFPVARYERLIDAPVEEDLGLLHEARLAFDTEAEQIDARVLEQAMISTLMEEAAVLIRALRGAGREFLRYWMRRFELINLKTIIRGRVAHWSSSDIREQLIRLGPLTALPEDELVQTEDLGELLRRLERSQYAEMAREARAIYEEKHQLFDVEAALDRQYFTGLIKRLNTLPASDRRPLARLLGAVMDQVNLVWMLRYRLGYGLAPPHAYYLLAQGGHHLHRALLLELVQLNGLREVLEALPAPLHDTLEGAETVAAVEAIMEAETEKVARAVLAHTAFTLARPCAVLLLREKQMLRLHAIIRGKHLQLDPGLLRAAAGLPQGVA